MGERATAFSRVKRIAQMTLAMIRSSAEQSALTALLQYDYVTFTILTAVGYDYVLTFSNEVEYIWSERWTWVSTLFIFVRIKLSNVRYFGLCNFVISVLVGGGFLPGSVKTYVLPVVHEIPNTTDICNSCEIIYMINGSTFLLFLGAADFVMILRVWAMYHRSRLILGTLLTLFSMEIIAIILAVVMGISPRNTSVVIIQTLDYPSCVVLPTPVWLNEATILRITHGAAMGMLAIIQFVRQSLQMYRVTNQWQLNRYMNLLVKQGILYFFAIFLFNLVNVLPALGKGITERRRQTLLLILEYVPMYTLTPRFILSIRELYARDVRRGGRIDTGFGVSLSGSDTEGTAIVFVDDGQSEVLVIPIDDRSTQPV
ncbi:hypothetical protein OG21DRAFT_1486496 [Imleria badia]|nr:hypothetical protein OG21DRAFT_1486496 [Imleria badia]